MARFIATMVKGDPKSHPTQTFTCMEERPAGAPPRSKRKTHEWVQGRSIEVSAELAKKLAAKRHPVTRGPAMFEIKPVPATTGTSTVNGAVASPRPAPERRVRIDPAPEDSPRVRAPSPPPAEPAPAAPEPVAVPTRGRRKKV